MASRLFDPRQVMPGDSDVFKTLSTDWVGLRCSAWRKSYGRTGHLHFGALRPKAFVNENTVFGDEGELVLYLFNCTRIIRWSSVDLVSSRMHGDNAVLAVMPSLVGRILTDVIFEDSSLDLTLEFDTTVCLTLSVDSRSAPDSELWNLIDATIEAVAYADRSWGVFRRGEQ